MGQTETEKVGILGGGLTGLTLGYLLQQRGIDFEVLEKENTCGGLMRTLREDGFCFDYGGSHIIFSKNRQAMNLMLALLGDNKVQNRRNTKILYKGHYVKYPFENGLSDLPKEENFECLYEFIQNLIQKQKHTPVKATNLKEWFYLTFGKGIAEKYLVSYNEKIWKYPTAEMALNWVDRIPDPPVEDVVKASLGLETEGYTHQLYFYYPLVGGIQAIVDVLERKLEGHITRRFNVSTVRKEGNQWSVSNGKEEKTFDKVITTIPLQQLVEAIDAPRNVKAAARSLKYNSIITVMVGLNKPKPNDLSWLYIPDKNVITHRVSFLSNYSPCIAPAGKSAVLAEITCHHQDCLWNMTDQQLTASVVADLSSLNIINKEDVCFSHVKRTQYAYVICDLDYDHNLGTVTSFMQQIGVGLVGRFAEFKYLNMDGCIESALKYMATLEMSLRKQEKPLVA